MSERERRPRPGREAACQICNAEPARPPAVPGRRTLEATNIARHEGLSVTVSGAPSSQGFEPAE